jgi:hypothetical protein
MVHYFNESLVVDFYVKMFCTALFVLIFEKSRLMIADVVRLQSGYSSRVFHLFEPDSVSAIFAIVFISLCF